MGRIYHFRILKQREFAIFLRDWHNPWVFDKTLKIIKKWRQALLHRSDLDVLMTRAADNGDLKHRLEWLSDLIQWIRAEGLVKSELDFDSGLPQAARIKYFLNMLEHHPEWAAVVGKELRAIIRETHAVNLFLQTGLYNQVGFLQEVTARIQKKFLPMAPQDSDLAVFFTQTFKNERDVTWICQLDNDVFIRLTNLIYDNIPADEPPWNSLLTDTQEAMSVLTLMASGGGLSPVLRARMRTVPLPENPFYVLPQIVRSWVNEKDAEKQAVFFHQVQHKITDCFSFLSQATDFIANHGISIEIVYRIEAIESQLNRLRVLTQLWTRGSQEPLLIRKFFAQLVLENVLQRSVLALFAENFSLISRKIVEHSGETGQHYITRSGSESWSFLKKAAGGGLITGFTILLKAGMSNLGHSFFAGLMYSLNYSISFVAIQLCGFTLATKQPAMTAPALAARMSGISNPIELQNLVDEIVHLIRSQMIAVLGNMLAVIPTMVVIDLILQSLVGQSLMSPFTSTATIRSFSIWGPTPFYAIFTGGLLWASSLFAGWMENWYSYWNISSALSANRRLLYVFGTSGTQRIVHFFKRNVSGFAASVSLGFLLGLFPIILEFLGLHLEVRHITLSTGSLAAACMSLGSSVFRTPSFWLAVVGIGSMALFNILVAFILAFIVAIQARRVEAAERKAIYRALLLRLKRNPLSFFWPPRHDSTR